MGGSLDEITLHRDIYRRLSPLDRRLQAGGMPVERRQALWAGLEVDPMLRQILDDTNAPHEFRDRVRSDIAECRRLRDQAMSEDAEWVATSIFAALLSFFYLAVDSDEFVFRGHLDADWLLVPSFFRIRPRVSIQLLARMIYGSYRWAEAQAGEPLRLGAFGAEAAAQHYGSGTTLLDTTESMRVAAYFATRQFGGETPESGVGAIFVLSVRDLEAMGRGILRGRDLPESLARIHRTKGAFISGLRCSSIDDEPVDSAAAIVSWLNREVAISEIDEVGLGIWTEFLASPHTESAVIRFRQTGAEFTDEAWNVTRSFFGDTGR